MAAVAAIAESSATMVVTRKLLSGSTFSGSSAKAVIDISFGSIPYKYRVYTGSRPGALERFVRSSKKAGVVEATTTFQSSQ